MRPFNPDESAEFLIWPQPDGGVFIQGGCYYDHNKKFVRVSESRRKHYEAWLRFVQKEEAPQPEVPKPETTPEQEEKFRPSRASNLTAKKYFVKNFGAAAWDKLPSPKLEKARAKLAELE